MSDRRYSATLDTLFRLRRFGARPGLEVIRALLGALGHPEATFRAIHVAGSKGKGSVAALSADLLSAHGARAGLFTSPHLQSYRERIQIDRVPIPEVEVVRGVERIHEAQESLLDRGTIDRPPTFFEVTTALAFDWFRHESIDRAVIEVGLGGRLDSTNVVQSPVGVITTIELEHTEVLGSTLTAIAREKAGIFQPGMTALVGESKPEPLAEIERVARDRGVPVLRLGRELSFDSRTLDEGGQHFSIQLPGRRLNDLRLPLLGRFQPANAVLATAAVERFLSSGGEEMDGERTRSALARARWRGRLERVAGPPDLFLDVAHTPESTQAVAESLGEIYPFLEPEENALLFGCLEDKPVSTLLDRLSPLARTLVVVPVRSGRSAEVGQLRRVGSALFPRVVVATSAAEGLRWARTATDEEGFTLAVGSDYLIGEVLDVLEGRPPEGPDLSDPAVEPAASVRTPTGRR